jgi:uncharacterized protein YbbK (DUF523 family)/uncharacterized protein YbgA (DUF1722 family)
MAEGETRTLRVGISACLLGERVRYDGGHKRHAVLVAELGPRVEWVAVCPEVELGLGVPRPPIDLVRVDGAVRFRVATTGEDLTDAMRAYAAWRARGLASLALDGYVLKSKSPSCGLVRVPVRGDAHGEDPQTAVGHGGPTAQDPQTPSGRGLFAAALAEAMPHLPMEDEARLARAPVRAHFVERLLAAARWRELTKRPLRAGDLVAFHTAHKYAVLAHSPAAYARLGGVVANAGRRRLDDVLTEYGAGFAAAYATPATRGRHVNVLEHMAGFFTRALSDDERAELTGAIADYGRGATTLEDPRALIRAHVRRLGVTYLEQQVYLQTPDELS